MQDSLADVVSGLNPVQREAVEALDGPVLIVAGAGSGKTRVITHRVANLLRHGVSPRNVLAITFTNKAAGEMRERIERLVGTGLAREMWVMTFHAACARILRMEAERLGLGKNFTIYDDGDSQRVISACLKELNLDAKRWTPRSMSAVISNAKNACLGPEAFASAAASFPERVAADVYKGYAAALRRANALDFDDLIAEAVRLLEEHPEALARWQNRFRYVVVDEYQDTNHAQYRVLALLSGKHRNLCVVGDEDQSVYKFRGATIRNILEFERDYPDARVFKLEQNYRSTQTILDAANGLIRNNRQRKDKRLFTERGGGAGIVRYRADDEHDEAHFVAGEIGKLAPEGYSGKDVAVFYRTNAQSRVLEEIFFRYGITYRVVGGLKFYERKEIRDAIAYLRAAHNPADSVSVQRAISSPKRGVGDGSMAKLELWSRSHETPLGESLARADEVPGLSGRARNGCAEVARVLRLIRERDAAGAPLSDIVRTAWTESGLLDELQAQQTPEAEGRIENLQELAGVAEEFSNREDAGDARLADFLERTSLIAEVDVLSDANEIVTLMTLHNAKGLEYPIVFLTGMEEGVFPHIRSLDDPDDLEEERRLAYVGITRAQDRLHISHAWSRSLWGGTNYNPVSRFVGEIPEELVEVRGKSESPRLRGWDSPAPARQAQAPRPGAERFVVAVSPGDAVMHEAFGVGEVLQVSGSGSDTEVTVRFDDEGDKVLLLAYANLSKAR
ncbi:MAG TPA: UvrD-helicase domain-containing protein [Actinomycetota bacterium]|nr:UvrD-helicase domain-containing protein [Actinomycetota bacterium]